MRRSRLPALSTASFLFPLLVLALVLAAMPAAGQGWKGTGRAQGRVLDEDGKPLAGAQVSLSREAGEGPDPMVTNRRGRWAILGLAAGRWKLRVEAAGYVTADGWVDVAAQGPAPDTDVQLRPLDEVSPYALESSTSTIHVWLERANSLLEQGRHAEARAEYEKALPVLNVGERAEVLRSIARTHYLEGDREQTTTALRQALLDAPEDAETRQLYRAVSESYGESAEAEAWLGRLDTEGADALAEEMGRGAPVASTGGDAPEIEPLPRRDPSAHQTGAYAVSFEHSSPLSGIETWVERYGVTLEEIAEVDPAAGRYALAEETYEVYVPESYDPSRPAGLFVWVSPVRVGGVRGAALREVLAEKNLIWIGANDSGNPRPKWTRMGLALDAVENMRRLYALDPERIYVGGYSGGGRVASALIAVFPEVFQGAFCFMGVDHFNKVPLPDKPGAHWPPAYPKPSRAWLRTMRRTHRYALVTGELDFNRAQTRAYHREFEEEGFRHVTYLEIPEATHYSGLDAATFRRGLEALDAPLATLAGGG